ncbi:thioredoxin domain-containing protein [Modestobacter sp. VKM Ac-2986]|uniref:DsbA family protein n=1 Tax=Modestobacter sp. VKM Ac-2986 TaxID=3004140 RepID=UPI0022ABBEF3|nr:thioredoxin domain-containing protein [Modestobacter sp. VKM Ac-2986]MCZ2830501.1 thioredoxin domain-containing protein [Modestobacter sp. VKM Ac-2986]
MSADTTRPQSGKAAARARIAERRAAEAAALAAAQRRRRTMVGGVVAAAVLVVALVAVVLVQTHRTSTDAAASPPNTVDGYAFAVGPADAPVTVDVYEDFQCPACAQLEQTSGDTLASLVDVGTVQVRYHGMAFLDQASTTDYSTRALNAAAVVAESGTDAYRAFHDLLFADQPAEGTAGLSDDQLVEHAAQAGAVGAGVESGIRDLRYGDWVAAATEQASKDGVSGTPTVLVDGRQLEGAELTPAGITAAVQAAAGS